MPAFLKHLRTASHTQHIAHGKPNYTDIAPHRITMGSAVCTHATPITCRPSCAALVCGMSCTLLDWQLMLLKMLEALSSRAS